MRSRTGTLVAAAILAFSVSLLPATPASASRAAVSISAANLGDSFSSGEGGTETGPYLPGSEDHCHRSQTSAAQLLGKTGLIKVTADAACSGAITADIEDERLGEPAQKSQLNASHRLVFVMIGGNDIRFGPLAGCFIQLACVPTGLPAESLRLIAEDLGSALDSAYDAIAATAPHARVVVGMYPPILPTDPAALNPKCWYLDQDELFVGNKIINNLNAVITQQARDHGFRVADPTRGFIGHDVCSNHPYFYLPGTPGTFHPNLLGRVTMAVAFAVASF
jgi:lysophospholipase L1-like esterase